MKKVYCNTCKYLCLEKDLKVRDHIEFTNSDSGIRSSTELCRFEFVYTERWEDNPIEPYKIRYISVRDPYASNRHNDCKNYERSASKSVKSILNRIFKKE